MNECHRDDYTGKCEKSCELYYIYSMISWREIPFVRLVVPFVLGIVLQDYLRLEWNPVAGLFFLTLFLVFAFYFSRAKLAFSGRYFFGLFLFIGLVLFGSILLFVRDDSHYPNHFKNFSLEHLQIGGRVVKLQTDEQFMKLTLKAEQASSPSEKWTKSCTGNLLVYFPVDASSSNVDRGDYLRIKSRIQPILENKNPHAFDFARYWHLKNLHYQTFPKEEEWSKVKGRNRPSLLNRANHIRKKLLKVLRVYLPTQNEFGVGAALILGEKSDLRPNIREAFAETGSMHILAVSGLHTGLVFLLVNFLLGFIYWKKRWWRWLKAIILLLSIWSFALVTGASPSVLRSATMFSFIIVGNAMSRAANIYNVLAASAFCLLIYEPQMLFEPGFQLSYLAVTGIVYFQPRIYKWWFISNKIGDYAWRLTSVSIAAQIMTLPLSLLYFHQFPLYFWLSGLVVIPAAVIILPLGFALFIVHAIPLLGWGVGQLLYGIIWLLNSIIFQINALPYGLVKGIWISGFVAFLLYLLIGSMMGFLETKKAKWLIAGLLIVNLVLVLNVFKKWGQLNQEEIVVYHLPKATLIDFIGGESAIVLSSDNLPEKKEQFAAANNRAYRGIKDARKCSLSDSILQLPNFYRNGNLIQFQGKKMAFVDPKHLPKQQKVKIDYLLVTQNAISSIEDISSYFDFEMLIFDGSNSNRKVKGWLKEAASHGIRAYYTGIDGALEIKKGHTNRATFLRPF